MSLHLMFTRHQCLYIWNLLKTVQLQRSCRPELSLRLHSAVPALVQVIHLPTMHSLSDTLRETSLTVRVQSFSQVRSHLLPLWMPDRSQPQQQTRDTSHRLPMCLTRSESTNTTLTAQSTKTEYLIQRVLPMTA